MNESFVKKMNDEVWDSLILGGLFNLEREQVMPKKDCPECRGTGQYVGLNKIEPCSLCAAVASVSISRLTMRSSYIWALNATAAVNILNCVVADYQDWNKNDKDPNKTVSDAMRASTDGRGVFNYLADTANRDTEYFRFELLEVGGEIKFRTTPLDKDRQEIDG